MADAYQVGDDKFTHYLIKYINNSTNGLQSKLGLTGGTLTGPLIINDTSATYDLDVAGKGRFLQSLVVEKEHSLSDEKCRVFGAYMGSNNEPMSIDFFDWYIQTMYSSDFDTEEEAESDYSWRIYPPHATSPTIKYAYNYSYPSNEYTKDKLVFAMDDLRITSDTVISGTTTLNNTLTVTKEATFDKIFINEFYEDGVVKSSSAARFVYNHNFNDIEIIQWVIGGLSFCCYDSAINTEGPVFGVTGRGFIEGRGLTINGETTLNGDLTVGTLTTTTDENNETVTVVSNNTILNTELSVVGSTVISDTLTVDGTTTLNNNLIVEKQAHFKANATFDTTLEVGNSMSTVNLVITGEIRGTEDENYGTTLPTNAKNGQIFFKLVE